MGDMSFDLAGASAGSQISERTSFLEPASVSSDIWALGPGLVSLAAQDTRTTLVNRAYFGPLMFFNRPWTLTGVGVDVTTAVASSSVRLMVVSCGSDYLPDDVTVLDPGATVPTTATGPQSITGLILNAPAGWFRAGVVPVNGAPTLMATRCTSANFFLKFNGTAIDTVPYISSNATLDGSSAITSIGACTNQVSTADYWDQFVYLQYQEQ